MLRILRTLIDGEEGLRLLTGSFLVHERVVAKVHPVTFQKAVGDVRIRVRAKLVYCLKLPVNRVGGGCLAWDPFWC